MKRSTQTRPTSSPIPVRFSQSTIEEIEETAKAIDLSKQDTIRLAVRAGLRILRKLGGAGIADIIAAQDDPRRD
jgi:hypothetical protein